jgi:hypothetical protein
MFAKTMIAVSVAVVLGAASAALASDRESTGGYQLQTRQGIQGLNHPSYVTDAGRAYALDESSKAKKKKVSKQQKPEPSSTSGQASKSEKPVPPSTSGKASKSETEEQARQRRFYER